MPTVADHPDVRAALDLFTAWIGAQMAYAGQPGLSAGIVHEQELIWARGFGWADPEQRVAATPETLYRIASITKLFTATAILQLRDAGRLRLDDAVAHHLPWFKLERPVADAPPVTIRHLLTHTSGLPRESPFPYWTDARFPSIEEVRAALSRQSAILAPDTLWKYSNLALTLAGEIVAAVAGQPWSEYVERHVLAPLGMASTLARTPAPDHPGLARGHGRRLPDGTRAASPFTDTRGIAPSANMTTSVQDLARFAMLQLRDGPAGGAQVLAGATLREMQRVHWLDPDWKAGWGLGFRVLRVGERTSIGHGGAVPGFRTQIRVIPADRVAIIVLTNADDGNPLSYVERATEWVVPAIAAAKPPAGPAAWDPAWERYLGRYRSAWGDLQVLRGRDGLVIVDPGQPDPLISRISLSPAGERAFRIATPDGYGSHGELVTFELDAASGRVARMRIGQNWSAQVEEW
jgi:CubicO group peptidase (beta-lactamase class C family)